MTPGPNTQWTQVASGRSVTIDRVDARGEVAIVHARPDRAGDPQPPPTALFQFLATHIPRGMMTLPAPFVVPPGSWWLLSMSNARPGESTAALQVLASARQDAEDGMIYCAAPDGSVYPIAVSAFGQLQPMQRAVPSVLAPGSDWQSTGPEVVGPWRVQTVSFEPADPELMVALARMGANGQIESARTTARALLASHRPLRAFAPSPPPVMVTEPAARPRAARDAAELEAQARAKFGGQLPSQPLATADFVRGRQQGHQEGLRLALLTLRKVGANIDPANMMAVAVVQGLEGAFQNLASGLPTAAPPDVVGRLSTLDQLFAVVDRRAAPPADVEPWLRVIPWAIESLQAMLTPAQRQELADRRKDGAALLGLAVSAIEGMARGAPVQVIGGMTCIEDGGRRIPLRADAQAAVADAASGTEPNLAEMTRRLMAGVYDGVKRGLDAALPAASAIGGAVSTALGKTGGVVGEAPRASASALVDRDEVEDLTDVPDCYCCSSPSVAVRRDGLAACRGHLDGAQRHCLQHAVFTSGCKGCWSVGDDATASVGFAGL